MGYSLLIEIRFLPILVTVTEVEISPGFFRQVRMWRFFGATPGFFGAREVHWWHRHVCSGWVVENGVKHQN